MREKECLGVGGMMKETREYSLTGLRISPVNRFSIGLPITRQ